MFVFFSFFFSVTEDVCLALLAFAGLYPSDDLEAAKCDASMGCVADFYANVKPSITEEDQAKKVVVHSRRASPRPAQRRCCSMRWGNSRSDRLRYYASSRPQLPIGDAAREWRGHRSDSQRNLSCDGRDHADLFLFFFLFVSHEATRAAVGHASPGIRLI